MLPNKPPRRRPPEDLIWWVATVSLVLPWIAGALAVVGLLRITHGDNSGVWLMVLGAGIFVADIASDVWLHKIATSYSDEPGLNLPGARAVGRRLVLTDPIVAGRGRARIGDTVWMIEGPDLPAGACVRVVGRRSSVLIVAEDDALPPSGDA